jgi:hypothetical protein
VRLKKDINGLYFYSTEYVSLMQFVEISEACVGKTFTLTCCVENVPYSFTFVLTTDKQKNTPDEQEQIDFSVHYDVARGAIVVRTEFHGAREQIFNWAKLEYGSVATQFIPKHFAEELKLCQRYYQLVSNSYFDMLGSTGSDGSVFCGFVLPVQMRQSVSVVSRLTNFGVFADKYYDAISLSLRSYNNNYLNFISSNKITANIRVLKVYTDIDGLKLDAEIY